ncbi:MAG: hypothetical protein K9L59_18350, partial [Desulfobacterales bacterium]|nr:hypothetical protein [Desulfobacterales bacterium]
MTDAFLTSDIRHLTSSFCHALYVLHGKTGFFLCETSTEAGGNNRPVPALGFGGWRATLRRGRYWVIAGNTDATKRVP